MFDFVQISRWIFRRGRFSEIRCPSICTSREKTVVKMIRLRRFIVNFHVVSTLINLWKKGMSGIRSIPKSPDLLVMITRRISHVSQGVIKIQAPFPNSTFTDPDYRMILITGERLLCLKPTGYGVFFFFA